MRNPFSVKDPSDSQDSELVALAQQGDRSALEGLILRHQPWIYNIALRMVGSSQDAEDVTQEILIKVITKLSTFQRKGSLRAWLYSIVTNHVLNMKKRPREQLFSSFARHKEILDQAPDMDLPDPRNVPVEVSLLVEETKLVCMTGMLLCLDRKQRLVFILGGILGASSSVGSEIMRIGRENFRQRLSRARRQLSHFMSRRCGLMDQRNPCNCARKTRAAITAGYVDPHHLEFKGQYVRRVKSFVAEKSQQVDDFLAARCQRLFREQPFQESPDYVRSLKAMLDCQGLREIVNFN